MLIDLLASRAENASTKDNDRPLQEFTAWESTLRTPPAVYLGDRAAVTGMISAAFLAEFRRAAAAEQSHRGTVAEDEGVPPEWENAALLAEMAASMSAG